MSIKIISRFQQGNIRQWLREIIDLHRILHPNDDTITSQPFKKLGQPPYTSRMTATNRIHFDNLAFD